MDEHLRKEGRKFEAGGELDESRLLYHRLRAGEITKEGLHIASVLGVASASQVLEQLGEPEEDIEDDKQLISRLESLKNRDVIVRLVKQMFLNYLEQQKGSEEYVEFQRQIESVIETVDRWLLAEGHAERQKIANSLEINWPDDPNVKSLRSPTISLAFVINPAKRDRYGIRALTQTLNDIVGFNYDDETEEVHIDVQGRLKLINEARQPVIDWALNNEKDS